MTPIKYLILDLDGTLLDTESLCLEVAQEVLQGYGKQLTPESSKAALGRRPLDCWREVARVLKLDIPPEELLAKTEILLKQRWGQTKCLPGAVRLVRHLAASGVPFAIATSTPRSTFEAKMSGPNQSVMRDLLKHVVCGDEIERGKPAPDTFQAAFKLIGKEDSRQCLVLEDSPAGAKGAIAAGMSVIGVATSAPDSVRPEFEALLCEPDKGPGVLEVVSSLLAFRPEKYGLPPLTDYINGVIPIEEEPIFIKGEVVKGFGRGSKELGIPTANVADEAVRMVLAEAVTGIYAGWASIGSSEEVHKMVMSIGYNPFYGNKTKTAEPWILTHFPSEFYGQEIRLVACGYVRPETNFTSLQALTERIHQDAKESQEALEHPRLLSLKSSPMLRPS